MTVCSGSAIQAEDLPSFRRRAAKSPEPPAEEGEPVPLREMEKQHIQHVLDWTGDNKRRAAQILAIDRSTLYEKIKLHGLPA